MKCRHQLKLCDCCKQSLENVEDVNIKMANEKLRMMEEIDEKSIAVNGKEEEHKEENWKTDGKRTVKAHYTQ